ncbi:PREDICTED: phosphatidylinositol-glycan biosynthesis class F protein-like [Tarenaya hassleriana]|uniref:phosphatidylinositol-glycan biosynthesis class F protein-like n=1 Tax=Tarenaya hassleriana TaxID=28532 RepID=UPI00053C7E47|nr:PREDICTED: phosphatidylinositol-glycan biosynthesis class F protein-like [Tarenaya hassleriana]
MIEARKKKPETTTALSGDGSVSASVAFSVYLVSGLFLAVGFWVAHNVYAVDLVSDPYRTLRLIWSIEFPVVAIVYSLFRQKPDECSYWRAAARSIIGLVTGALVNALGAIVLGAPVGLQYLWKTINWSLLMSVFTFVPAAAVFGASWADWHRMFSCMKPTSNRDYMITVPAYGAIIGAWFGAWPMPLDWERPWQEWPISVSYGAIGGYIAGKLVSLVLIIFKKRHLNAKLD